MHRIGLAFLLIGFGLVGCQGDGTRPEVATGTFRAQIEGAIDDTLTGPGRYRLREGRLVGMELGRERDPGLSIDLEPLPLDRRTYEVVSTDLFQVDRPGTPPGVVAFHSSSKGARFVATDGTLDITYLEENQVAGTFTFAMEGDFETGSSETLSIQVTGAFNAKRGGVDASSQ